MRTSDFDYDLPRELIAQEPVEPRDSARLMVLRRSDESIEHLIFRDLPDLLDAGDLLVVNDTRVMAARIRGRRKASGGAVEALLVRRLEPACWETLFRPARHAEPGSEFVFSIDGTDVAARSLAREGGTVVLEFGIDFDPSRAGEVPLPPYIKSYAGDPDRYQTVYAREARSAAAPTAGLHFTPALLERLLDQGIQTAAVTLEVGPGTFVPVTADDPADHAMHAEHFTVPAASLEAIRAARLRGDRVVAVGTTVVRTLEHLALAGEEAEYPHAMEGWTGLKILPGHRFRAVDAMVTNFHLPRSTLLMLVSAFIGREFALRAYAEAVARRYRFFSFGDAMLLL
jgi:S-adenosylmethionine:tRNA ribosyltransferase-isomerase